MTPTLVWFRRDLRLSDHPALAAAVARGGPVIPVFLHDEGVESLGAAPRFRMGLSLDSLARDLARAGSALILRRGAALPALRALIDQTGAGAVHWTRDHDPAARPRDMALKAALTADGIVARSFPGQMLFDPRAVTTGQGGFYRVYTPFWRAVAGRDPGPTLPAPGRIPPPASWPASDRLESWAMDAPMRRGAAIVAARQQVGESAARARLDRFVAGPVAQYRERRDFPAEAATSGLSENLAWGEISARQVWHAGQRARELGAAGAEHFLKELVWREFAWHLAHHTPHITTANWRPAWDDFPWSCTITPAVTAWMRGRTGVPLVDAGMRQMYVTGTMHNRVRMIAASYLTKHLMTHWKIGLDWFACCLTDWDPAANAMGWQWVAGSGPDAAPYFRIFNPVAQAQTFDAGGAYVRAWIAEGQARPPSSALEYFEAIPRSWAMTPDAAYPSRPVVALADGRARALAAWAAQAPTKVPQGNS